MLQVVNESQWVRGAQLVIDRGGLLYVEGLKGINPSGRGVKYGVGPCPSQENLRSITPGNVPSDWFFVLWGGEGGAKTEVGLWHM